MKSFKNIPEDFLVKWQEIANMIAKLIKVPAVLIMKKKDEFMEVFISSNSENNPYKKGDKEHWAGLYCETVIKSQHKLLIPNALKDKDWDKNPEIKLGMIAYLGFPLNFPDKTPFGTICVLDNKENDFSDEQVQLLHQFKNIIEIDLALIQSLEIKKSDNIIEELIKQKNELSSVNEELEKAQIKTEDSEEKCRAIFNISQALIFIADINTSTLKFINPAFNKILGYSDEELLSKPFLEFIHPDDITTTKEIVQKKLKQGLTVNTFENRYRCKDGTYRWFNWNSYPVPEKGITYSIAYDVTEIKKKEIELKTKNEEYEAANEELRQINEELVLAKEKAEQSEIEFKSVFDNSQDAIGISKEGINVFFNKSYLKLFGYESQDELIGKSLLEQIAVSEREKILEKIKKRAKGENFPNQYETIGLKKNGTEVPLEINVGEYFLKGDKYTIAIIRDITNRKKAEQKLKTKNEEYEAVNEELRQSNEELALAKEKAEESEANVTAIIEGTNKSIWAFDREYNILYINKIFKEDFFKSFGVRLETGMSLIEALPEPLQPIWKPRYDKVLANEQFSIEDAVPTKIGTLYIEVTFNPILKNGQVIGGSCFGSDITYRKNSEKELLLAKEKAEESEESLSLLIENIPYAVFANDIDGNIILVNKMAQKYTGYTKDELLKMTVGDIDHESVVRDDRKNIWQKLQKGENKNFESVHYKKDGTKYPVDLNIAVLTFKNQKIILVIVQDITERKKAEQKLLTQNKEYEILNKELKLINEELTKTKERAEESEYKLRGMFQNNQIGFVFCDTQGDIIEINKAIIDILGSPSIEATKQINLLTFKPLIDAGFSEKLQQSIDEQKTIFDEIQYKSKWGVSVFIKYQLIPLLVKDKLIGIWVNLNDFTDLWKSKQEIIKAKEKAEESDRLKTAFLQNLSHEIRTPLNAVCGFSSLIINPKISEEKRSSFSSIIKNSSNQLLSVVSDILTISSLETNQEQVNIEKVSINNMIVDLLSIFKLQSNNQNISLYAKKQLNDGQCQIYTDKTKLRQILTNLISNALKFTHKGSVEFGYKLKDNNLEFYVKDTGIGIKAELHKKIFERFRQAETGLTKKYSGTGLGLSISKGFVELLGGKIWVESKIDKGSKFYFTIPYKPTKEYNEANILKKINENPTILVAEDEEFNFLYIEELLIDNNFKLLHAKDGQEAIDIFKSNSDIELILMDIKMPIIDGYTAAKMIRKINPKLPIIAQSAYALVHEIEKFKGVFDDYLPKPINKKDLIEKVNKYLKKK